MRTNRSSNSWPTGESQRIHLAVGLLERSPGPEPGERRHASGSSVAFVLCDCLVYEGVSSTKAAVKRSNT